MRVDAARRWQCASLVAIVVIAAGCTSTDIRDSAPTGSSVRQLPPDAVPRPEPRSRYGNGPIYEVFGERYTVLDTSSGYRERGVASWYGKKFHGRLTSSREPYDMYEMTAAHKTLPLPTYVKVRNLRNDRTVIVRVNDRGPFVHNRVIDLSYAAATKLDMVRDGTSLVEVTAITFDEPGGDRPVRNVTAPEPTLASRPAPRPATAVSEPPPAAEPAPDVHGIYAQVGAFGSRDNAQSRLDVLKRRGIGNAFIHADSSGDTTMYRVRVGPIKEVIQFDMLVEELENLEIPAPYLVTD